MGGGGGGFWGELFPCGNQKLIRACKIFSGSPFSGA